MFASLTWANAKPPTSPTQRKLLFAYLRGVASAQKIPFRQLLWVVRQERGEKTFRPHYHALIGWRGQQATVGQCFALNQSWLQLHRLCGWSRHFVYDCGQDAVGYITKGLSGTGRDTTAASHYEAGKFGWSENEVILSGALLRLVSRASRIKGQNRPGQSEKRVCALVESVANIPDKNQP